MLEETNLLQQSHNLQTAYLEKLSFKWTRNIQLNSSELELSADDKYQICRIWHEGFDPNQRSTSAASFAKAHGINPRTFHDWKRAYFLLIHQGIRTLHDRGGRPNSIDQESLQELLRFTKQSESEQHSLSKKRFRDKFLAEMVASKKRRGEGGSAKACCRKTVGNYRKQYCNEVPCQLKTEARIKAEADPRNALSMISMALAFCEDKADNPEMIFNWDATQFTIEYDHPTKTSIVIKPERANDELIDGIDIPNHGSKKTVTDSSSGKLGFAVKLYHFHHADGICAPPVFVIADAAMDESSLDVYKVPRLSNVATSFSFGWLCFTKTRCCNSAFYQWFAKEVVVPFVLETRSAYESKYADGSWMRAFITCDGEAKQIEVFQEDDILTLFNDNNIDLGKTPASCSAICQSSDASPFFKAAKKALSFIDTNFRKSVRLTKALSAIIRTRQFTDQKKTTIIDALQRIVYVLHEVLRPRLISEGYEILGQYPLDFDKAMLQCTAVINGPTFEHMRSRWRKLADIFRENGVLTEADMDALDIPFGDEDGKPKDARALHKQRAVVMNSVVCVQQYRQYKISQQLSLQRQQINRQQRQALRNESEESKRKRDAYNEWFHELPINDRKAQRRLWKDAGGKWQFIEALDLTTLPSNKAQESAVESESEAEDEPPLTLVLRRS